MLLLGHVCHTKIVGYTVRGFLWILGVIEAKCEMHAVAAAPSRVIVSHRRPSAHQGIIVCVSSALGGAAHKRCQRAA